MNRNAQISTGKKLLKMGLFLLFIVPLSLGTLLLARSTDASLSATGATQQDAHSVVTVDNGDFETGDFSNWSHGGELPQSITNDDKHSGTFAALLGDPALGGSNCLTVEEEPNNTSAQALEKLPLCSGIAITGTHANSNPGEEYDIYRMEVQESETMVVSLKNIPANTNYDLYLYNNVSVFSIARSENINNQD